MQMTNVTAVVAGGVMVAIGLGLLAAPGAGGRLLSGFPRNRGAAWILTAVVIAWSAVLLNDTPLGILDAYKGALYVIAPLAVLLLGVFVDEMLSVRALGGLMLLFPAPMLAAARLCDSPLRVVISVFGYLFVIKGLVLVLAPYNFRRAAGWMNRSTARMRLWAAGCLLAGAALALLGWCVR